MSKRLSKTSVTLVKPNLKVTSVFCSQTNNLLFLYYPYFVSAHCFSHTGSNLNVTELFRNWQLKLDTVQGLLFPQRNFFCRLFCIFRITKVHHLVAENTNYYIYSRHIIAVVKLNSSSTAARGDCGINFKELSSRFLLETR